MAWLLEQISDNDREDLIKGSIPVRSRSDVTNNVRWIQPQPSRAISLSRASTWRLRRNEQDWTVELLSWAVKGHLPERHQFNYFACSVRNKKLQNKEIPTNRLCRVLLKHSILLFITLILRPLTFWKEKKKKKKSTLFILVDHRCVEILQRLCFCSPLATVAR